MGILWLMGAQQSAVLFLLLVAALGLTWWEARQQDFDRRLAFWWISVVGMTHVLGYLALRALGCLKGKAATDDPVPTVVDGGPGARGPGCGSGHRGLPRWVPGRDRHRQGTRRFGSPAEEIDFVPAAHQRRVGS